MSHTLLAKKLAARKEGHPDDAGNQKFVGDRV